MTWQSGNYGVAHQITNPNANFSGSSGSQARATTPIGTYTSTGTGAGMPSNTTFTPEGSANAAEQQPVFSEASLYADTHSFNVQPVKTFSKGGNIIGFESALQQQSQLAKDSSKGNLGYYSPESIKNFEVQSSANNLVQNQDIINQEQQQNRFNFEYGGIPLPFKSAEVYNNLPTAEKFKINEYANNRLNQYYNISLKDLYQPQVLNINNGVRYEPLGNKGIFGFTGELSNIGKAYASESYSRNYTLFGGAAATVYDLAYTQPKILWQYGFTKLENTNFGKLVANNTEAYPAPMRWGYKFSYDLIKNNAIDLGYAYTGYKFVAGGFAGIKGLASIERFNPLAKSSELRGVLGKTIGWIFGISYAKNTLKNIAEQPTPQMAVWQAGKEAVFGAVTMKAFAEGEKQFGEYFKYPKEYRVESLSGEVKRGLSTDYNIDVGKVTNEKINLGINTELMTKDFAPSLRVKPIYLKGNIYQQVGTEEGAFKIIGSETVKIKVPTGNDLYSAGRYEVLNRDWTSERIVSIGEPVDFNKVEFINVKPQKMNDIIYVKGYTKQITPITYEKLTAYIELAKPKFLGYEVRLGNDVYFGTNPGKYMDLFPEASKLIQKDLTNFGWIQKTNSVNEIFQYTKKINIGKIRIEGVPKEIIVEPSFRIGKEFLRSEKSYSIEYKPTNEPMAIESVENLHIIKSPYTKNIGTTLKAGRNKIFNIKAQNQPGEGIAGFGIRQTKTEGIDLKELKLKEFTNYKWFGVPEQQLPYARQIALNNLQEKVMVAKQPKVIVNVERVNVGNKIATFNINQVKSYPQNKQVKYDTTFQLNNIKSIQKSIQPTILRANINLNNIAATKNISNLNLKSSSIAEVKPMVNTISVNRENTISRVVNNVLVITRQNIGVKTLSLNRNINMNVMTDITPNYKGYPFNFFYTHYQNKEPKRNNLFNINILTKYYKVPTLDVSLGFVKLPKNTKYPKLIMGFESLPFPNKRKKRR